MFKVSSVATMRRATSALQRSDDPRMTTTGELIGPYLLGECLGSGGFGAVYEGTHQETGQRVAIKFLHDTKGMEPEVQNRFVREVALLQRLDHENIVRLFEAGLHENKIYCAMELVECGSLKEVLIDKHQLPWREATEVALQVCYALKHAHERDCVHRDLKPANLYLAEDGLVKLGDLGLARDLSNSRLTAEGQTVGTWKYMPPEQITGQAQIDGRLDIYALGCILFEMVAGRVPFEGPDFATIFDQHLDTAPMRLDSLVSDCPKALADVVDRMLEKSPADRPKDAAELASLLEAVLAGRSPCGSTTETDTDMEESDSSILERGPNLTQRLQNSSDSVIASKPKANTLAIATAVAILLIAILVLMQRN